MKFPMHLPEPDAGNVGVDFRRVDARVTQEFLDDPQVRAMLQQMRGEAVSQHVRRDISLNA